MEKLTITNFLSIDHAEIEIKPINLFIGPQAQGKSVIAKLIYFFKDYPQTLVEAIYRGIATKEEADKLALAKFEKFFPKYTWEKHEFTVTYTNKYYSVSIANKPGKSSLLALELTSDSVIREAFDKFKKEAKDDDIFAGLFPINGFNRTLFDGDHPYTEANFYIPAGRSFFANIEKSIFSLIHAGLKIDYFLTSFGKLYHDIRDAINEGYSVCYEGENAQRLELIVNRLIGGNFSFEDGRAWISNDKSKIDITHASSGQQEVLPMAVILSAQPYQEFFDGQHFVIEEPETHLFPSAQNDIILLIANAYNYKPINGERINAFTIATHSPYILTAFNNLIQSGNVAASKHYQNVDELKKVVPESEWVDFNDVSAYLVDQGTVMSILNHELKLIDENRIDEVSEHFAKLFETLVGMEQMDD